MDLVTKTELDPAEIDACWAFYDRAFEGLRIQAAQRHAMTRDEFDEVMFDGRVTKHLVYDGTQAPCALATLTNDLKAVPLISPEFYEHRWPILYAEQRIWYVGFLAIDPDYHGTGVLAQVIGSICEVIPDRGGVVAADICTFNEERLLLPDTFARLAATFIRPPAKLRLDSQTYWGYEFASSI